MGGSCRTRSLTQTREAGLPEVHTTKVEEGLALRALLPAELVGGWGVGAVPEGWGAVPSVSSRGREESQATPSPPEAAGTPPPQKQADSQRVCSHSPA